MNMLRFTVAAAVFIVLQAGFVYGGSHHGPAEKKMGILLVAFGSSAKSAQISFENIDSSVKAAYPEIPVRWAYTSHMIRKKLAARGKELDSPEVALARMQDEGFTHVAVQSLHTIAGAEYHELQRVVGAFEQMDGFAGIMLGHPLLATQRDMERSVAALLSVIPQEREKEEAVVFMGHGTHHPANAFYAALAFQVQRADANVHVGTVEGYPELDVILAMLQEKEVKKAYLMPFMSVAGDHAKNDMAGEQESSWKSVLQSSGIEVVTVLKGTAEFEVFVDIWLDHLHAVLENW